nr:hypothetical protein [uncultured Pseudomonas sp.]
MQQRFVIVPALPVEKDIHKRQARAWASLCNPRFDLYDTLEKQRLPLSLKDRPEAEAECSRRNCLG